MTAAIPAAERVVAGRLAGPNANSGAVTQAKKTLTGKQESAPRKKTGPASVPDRGSRTSTATPTSSGTFGGYGRGARTPRRSSPRTSGRPMQPHVRVLVAEWMLAVILIVVTVPSEKGGKGYANMMTTLMLRLSGLTGIFFALSLIGTAQRAARFSIWFGFIIDLGILYHAASNRSGGTLAAIFTGKPILSESGGVTLAADFVDKSAPPQPTPFASSPSAPSSGTGASTSSGGTGANLSPNYPGAPGSTIPTPGIPA